MEHHLKNNKKEEEEGDGGIKTDQECSSSPDERSLKRKKVQMDSSLEECSSEEEGKQKEKKNTAKGRRAAIVQTSTGSAEVSSVNQLIQMFSDTSILERALRTNGLDIEKFKLADLTLKRIGEGMKELKRVETVFNEPNEDPLDLLLHSHSFYKLFPPARPYVPLTSPFPPVIQTQQQLSSKLRLLENLNSVLSAKISIEEAKKETKEGSSSFEYNLMKNLGVKIRRIDSTHPKYEPVSHYIKNTTEGSPFQLENLYSVEHDNEEEITKENRMLLCRGVSPYKHLSTLKNETDGSKDSTTANAILFSDIFYSSLEEAYNGEESTKRVCIHLYEVGLGSAFEGDFIVKELPKGFDSVICRGSFGPDPAQNLKTEEGYSIPIGRPRPYYTRSSLAASFSRYFVYNRNQIKLRFLAEIRYSDLNAQQQAQLQQQQIHSNQAPGVTWNVPPYNPMAVLQRSSSPILLPPSKPSLMGPPVSPSAQTSKTFT